jgi:hypothetical protein
MKLTHINIILNQPDIPISLCLLTSTITVHLTKLLFTIPPFSSMFRRTMPIIQLLDRAQRIRENCAAQAAAARVEQNPTPKPSAVSEWGFVDSAKQKSMPDSDSESSQSFSSSDVSEDAILLPSRPSSPHKIAPVEREVELIRVVSPACSAENEIEFFCTPPCDHNICKKAIHPDPELLIDHECLCKFLSAPPANICLQKLNITAATESYEDARKDEEIMVHYPAAFEVIQRLRKRGELDIWHFLLASPSYTKATIHTPTRHATAAKSANRFIFNGMDETLSIICDLPSQSRVITVRELEAHLNQYLRFDCVAWAQKWVGRKDENITWKWFHSEMQKNEGCRVLFEKAREYVRDVVGALVWWDLERREVEQVEQGRKKASLLVLEYTADMENGYSRHE